MLGNNLISLRRMKKMTQEDLADKLGVSRQTISKWETGDSIPDMEMGMKLADILQVSLDELMNYSSAKQTLPIPPKGKHAFGIVKVGDKGQIVIPAKARKMFDINPGDDLLILGDESQGLAIIKESDIMNFISAARNMDQ
ncbi:MAG: helix-turn-helix domain-containing protein [Oscillospiraceae bacterium]|nr:helix-turn-helix domain-containing protein [Oscillospiraceae bacterium]MCR5805628.1 helix-turn-helix domain-containing protein [Oscillospiraceae bacterium]